MKSSKKTEKKEAGVLPLPEPVRKHHAENLTPIFKRWQELKQVPPVLLLTGPAGIGKRHVAYYMAQWLLCEASGFQKQSDEGGVGLFGDMFGATTPAAPTESLEPCGQCRNCQRALSGSWVDFTEISPESSTGASDSSGSLKIEQFRQLKSTLGFSAHEGAFKITLISGADRMTTAAANSLLKILEEPPAGWIFLLTAGDASLLLPTLVSRCQKLRLRPFAAEQLKELLAFAEVPLDRQRICSELAEGSWSKALAMAGDEVWDQREAIFRFLECPQAELNNLVEWASQENKSLHLMIDQLEQMLEDLACYAVKGGSHDWINADGKRALAAHAGAVVKKLGSLDSARKFWVDRADRLAKARKQSQAPLNKKLLVQELLIPWLEV